MRTKEGGPKWKINQSPKHGAAADQIETKIKLWG